MVKGLTTKIILTLAFATAIPFSAHAQSVTGDSVMQHITGRKLSLGGYGEVALTRNFYSDNQYRYRSPSKYKDDPSNGRFDIPHAVIYLGYDFGKGWTLGTEIEFEHTGTGSATEIEADEGGEYEVEVEKGGEVELEQFWIQKSFSRAANLRMGHIVVPVGLTNKYHEPLNFFTVYRPEGESTILPSTWHDTGISFWGNYSDFRYELQFLAGLDAFRFSRDGWAHNAAASAYEFKPANKYGFAARIDNYSIPGLRVGISGYFGRAMHNTYPNEREGSGKTYDNLKGNVWIGAFDFTYNNYDFIVRGNIDYGTLSDAAVISRLKINTPGASPYDHSYAGKGAITYGVEAGYDIFSRFPKLSADNQKLYVFGRYEYYNSYIKEESEPTYEFTKKKRMAVGVNYYPVPQIAVKAEYSKRFLKSGYNDEPSVSLGVAYEGWFL